MRMSQWSSALDDLPSDVRLTQYTTRAFGLEDQLPLAPSEQLSSSTHDHLPRSILAATSYSAAMILLLQPLKLACRLLFARRGSETSQIEGEGHPLARRMREMSEYDLLAVLDGGAESLGMIGVLRR